MADAVGGADLLHSHTWYANLAGHLGSLLQALIALFAPGHVERHVLQRGAVAALQASAS
jgi:alpha-maltose-1-phosphate synthase